jgi:hypothetical protein
MRLAVTLLAVLAACNVYDPIDEIPHSVHPDTASAMREIIGNTPGTRVYAVGEYHPTRDSVAQHSPLARFTSEIIELLEPRAKHIVVEAWLDATCGSRDGVAAQVQRATGRRAAQPSDVTALVEGAESLHIQAHSLPMTCIEQSAMLDVRGRVDFLRLLETITEKLHDVTRQLVFDGETVIVYGGALHNDLYPRWPLEDLSYAHGLRAELGGVGVLELDLVVPEIIANMSGVRQEPWFPLIGLASPDRVTVWERGPDSYVVILPALSEAVAEIARPLRLRTVAAAAAR